MKVVFKKDPSKDYVCTNCGTQFNWDEEHCWWYGEYDSDPEAVLCSDECKEDHELSNQDSN